MLESHQSVPPIHGRGPARERDHTPIAACLALAAICLLSTHPARAQGGPDAFGYTWDYTMYDWVDLSSGLGTLVGITSDDAEVNVALPFTFPYYGIDYTTIRVGDNGGIRFSNSGGVSPNNECLPSASGSSPDLALHWDDLNCVDDVFSYHDTANGRAIVSFEGCVALGVPGDTGSFQVHLHPTGRIEYHFQDVNFFGIPNDNGLSASVGIQDYAGGTHQAGNALEVSCNAQGTIGAGVAIRLYACGDGDGDGYDDASCGGDDCDDADPTVNPGVDGDGDGSDVCEDCDDDDPTVNPGVDGDGDGADACMDCDDADASTYPGAPELCDGLDNDCNGVVGPGASQTFEYFTTTNNGTGGGRFRGDEFLATSDTTVVEIEAYLDPPTGGAELQWVIYETLPDYGAFIEVHSSTTSTAESSADWYSSGSISVPLVDGHYYVIGTWWSYAYSVGYWNGALGPDDPAWGLHLGGASHDGTLGNYQTFSTTYHGYPIRVGSWSPEYNEQDGDGDGYADCDGDCDDSDPVTYPGAPELCDGLDTDCDGSPGHYLAPPDTYYYYNYDEYFGGKFHATSDTTIVSFAVDLSLEPGDGIEFGVYEATTEHGVYTLVASTSSTAIDVGREKYDSGLLAVPVTAGRWYVLVATLPPGGGTCYPRSSGLTSFPYTTAWGDHEGGVWGLFPYVGLPASHSFGTSGKSFYMEVFTGSDESDLDGDGQPVCAGDCDEGDPLTYLGATEVCDGLDNDCDGGVPADETDGDLDGWSDCEGDCDDLEATVYPGAPELCDVLDNDCDGVVDGPDADGDGYLACEDCDDADATIHPAAVEDCGDGVDNDCDGDIDGGDADCVGDDDVGDDDVGDDDVGDDDVGDDDVGDDDIGDDDIGDDDVGDDDTAPGIYAGDVIFTEVMQNPSAVDDEDGEWFELYNITTGDLDLDGCVVSDAGVDTHTIAGPLVAPAEGYLVLGVNGDAGTNGGVAVDYAIPADLYLGNGDDELVLTCGLEVDRVEWDGGPAWPDPEGASMTLAPKQLDGTANDDGGHWCEASTAYGLGDLGTPGAANDDCTPPGDDDVGDDDGGDDDGGDDDTADDDTGDDDATDDDTGDDDGSDDDASDDDATDDDTGDDDTADDDTDDPKDCECRTSISPDGAERLRLLAVLSGLGIALAVRRRE